MRFLFLRPLAPAILLLAQISSAESQKWATSWAASVHGPYPSGNASAQPNLRFVFPTPADGARDQTFRLVVQPDVWGSQTRLHFSNVFGGQAITFDGVFAGLHWSAGAVVPGTNRSVRFGGKESITIAPGESVWSDAVPLTFTKSADKTLTGRKLAVSFHIAGQSGPMTW